MPQIPDNSKCHFSELTQSDSIPTFITALFMGDFRYDWNGNSGGLQIILGTPMGDIFWNLLGGGGAGRWTSSFLGCCLWWRGWRWCFFCFLFFVVVVVTKGAMMKRDERWVACGVQRSSSSSPNRGRGGLRGSETGAPWRTLLLSDYWIIGEELMGI